MTIGSAFDETIAYYDSWIGKAVPGYDEMFAIAAELFPFSADEEIRVLDLGAGTGLFSSLVLKKYPKARFVLYDLADRMLSCARERFRDQGERFTYLLADYGEMHDLECYDLVISSLSIHHLSDPDKQVLFRRVYDSLCQDGVFINIDQIRGPSDALQELYCDAWLRKVRAAGATDEEITGGLERRRTYDREATLLDQLRWLEAAGFTEVDCLYKNYLMGLFLAVKGVLRRTTS